MFFKKKYEVKELYIGRLGYVTYKENAYYIDQVNEIIIFKRKKLNSGVDYYAENLFTHQPYFFFLGNRYYWDTLDKVINNYAVHQSWPLEIFLTEPKMIITEQELLNLYKKLKKVFEEPTTETNKKSDKSSEEPLTDDILNLILKTNELAQKSKISPDRKKEIIEELNALGKNYVEAMIHLTECENNGLTLDDEYNIRMNYIRKLVDIEGKINDPKAVKTYSLKRQYSQFQNILNPKSYP